MRHGETEWSASGAHTSRTDLPLLPSGIKQAQDLAAKLKGHKFALVLVSPMERARETARLAGYADKGEVTDDLKEWDYGMYEGRSTAQIRHDNPNWSLWRDGVLQTRTSCRKTHRVGGRPRRRAARRTARTRSCFAGSTASTPTSLGTRRLASTVTATPPTRAGG